MAQLTRYFGTAAAGTADGTSYANRAALFDGSNNWSTVITGTNFNNDSLICYIDSGTYTCAQSLASTLFTNPPTNNRQISLIAAPGGTVWTPPNPSWTSVQPMWSTTNMPLIQCSSSSVAVLGNNIRVMCYGLRIEGQNSDGSSGLLSLTEASQAQWCLFENTASNSNARACNRAVLTTHNCVFRMSGTSYQSAVFSIGELIRLHNTRIEGNPSASSGNRFGVNFTSGGADIPFLSASCVHGFVTACEVSGTVASVFAHVLKSVMVGTTAGIVWNHSGTIAAPTRRSIYRGSIFANGTTGLAMNDTPGAIEDCLFITNTTNYTSDYDIHAVNVLTPADTLAQTFVDSGNSDYKLRDFRLRPRSAAFGKGIGVADEIQQTQMNGGFLS